MEKEIKLTEVTDIITPERETVPENYNFAIESIWTEEIFTSGGKTIDISASAKINVNPPYLEIEE